MGVWSPRFIVYITLMSVLFIIGLLRLRKISAPFNILVFLIGLGVASDLFSRFLVIQFRSGLAGYHIYLPLQYLFITIFYSFYLKNKFWFTYSPLLILIFSIINTLFFQSVWSVPSNVVLISSLIFVIYSLLTFKYLLSDVSSSTSLVRLDIFWCNAIIAAYFTCIFFCWSFYNFFLRHNIAATVFTNTIYYANYIYYFTLGISIYLNSKKERKLI